MQSLTDRARVFAALGDPMRLMIVDDLLLSDRTPGELIDLTGASSALLAHHLDVLEDAGITERFHSHSDRRKKFVRLDSSARHFLPMTTLSGRVIFVCTRNSARSQLAAALWTDRVGTRADSAGTQPSDRVHPLAVETAARHGLDLTAARPRRLSDISLADATVVTVCDHAHDELADNTEHLHWSMPDPAEVGTRQAFRQVARELEDRIFVVSGHRQLVRRTSTSDTRGTP